ncbi:hypothetical protein JCM16303_004884 [Sporobolomyces ruberrimus]
MLIEGIKFSCQSCIKGHRQANCNHADRELFEVKKRGRPITACETCRSIRKENNSHKTCNHCIKSDALEPDLVRSLPNGAADPAAMALVRRASSVRSRSSASSAPHPPLPPAIPGPTGQTQVEDLSTVGRKKSVSKSRRKDSSAAQKPHDLSHGHSAYHSTHHSATYSPYTHAHAHPPNHAPLSLSTDLPNPPSHYAFPSPLPRSPHDQSSLSSSLGANRATHSPRPPTNEELASSFFFRGFEQLEGTSSASSSVPGRPDSALSKSAASHSSDGAEASSSFKEPPRRPSIGTDQLPTPTLIAGRPCKERKRSGLAQMYGAEEEEDRERGGPDFGVEQQRKDGTESGPGQMHSANNNLALPHYPSSFNDFACPTTYTDYAALPNPNPSTNRNEPSPTTFSLPSCDYGIPRAYVPPSAEYSSTAPSAYSAYSGYTPPLERTTSYSVEEEEDPLGALADFQTQQTDLDILEWISSVAPLPPSSTPASTGDTALASSSLPSFEFQQHGDYSVSTPTSYPEPPPSSVGLASSDFAGLVLSPTSELESTNFFQLPSDSSSSLPPPSSSSSASFSQSQSQSRDQSRDRAFNAVARGQPDQSYPLPSFDSGDIHLERYGIDESYFARLGSFEPTATPTSTPVQDALATWERRIEQTKGLLMHEFGEKLQRDQQGGEGEQQQASQSAWESQLGRFEIKKEDGGQVREFATGRRESPQQERGWSSGNESGIRDRYEIGESSIEGGGPRGEDENNWWLKLNA